MFVIFLADGFEEVEALAPLDLLRRANCEVSTVAIGKKTEVTGSHGITVVADMTAASLNLSEVEGVILPGGMPGARHLEESPVVKEAVLSCVAGQKLVGAICAAPYVLGTWGVLQGKCAVCYPGYEDKLTGAVIEKGSVCVDKNIVTAKGAGVAVDFGLALVEKICGKETSEKIRKGIQCR